MSGPLSDEDKGFIRTILNNPAELTGWLAYADCLDERDDPRAEFIRLKIQLFEPENVPHPSFSILLRLKQLHETLNPYWLAVFDRPHIENCDKKFAAKCPKKWELLTGTSDLPVRECDVCGKKVYYCFSVSEAYEYAQKGDCLAVVQAVYHKPDDIQYPHRAVIGVMPLPPQAAIPPVHPPRGGRR